ncbi:MAG: adenylate/guanylate cyclase domain-containing protein [Deltaproteobacteria bacterium]|nr:adenylate/guanylate cyclase domain-containing protein [Deltaproteobacteria bacterium]
MVDKVYLQEMEATVVFFDVRGFSTLSAQLGPMDVGVMLSRYYQQVEEAVLSGKGRMVKFFSDAAMACFPGTAGVDHAGAALEVVRRLQQGLPAWLDENARAGWPLMEYAAGVATGTVLAGELGTARLRSYDVIGAAPALAAYLSRLANRRKVAGLVAAETVSAAKRKPPCIEVEGAEVGGRKVRIYRLLSPEEQAQPDAPLASST